MNVPEYKTMVCIRHIVRTALKKDTSFLRPLVGGKLTRDAGISGHWTVFKVNKEVVDNLIENSQT